MATKQKPRIEKTRRWLKYAFSPTEITSFSQDLASRVQSLNRLEEEKKEIADSFKARMSAEGAKINQISLWITNGFDFRDIDCEVQYHTPKTGVKSIVRLDTGELVETIEMGDAEMQEPLLPE